MTNLTPPAVSSQDPPAADPASGSPWDAAHRSRWVLIQAHSFDDGQPRSFIRRLMQAQGWSQAHATEAIEQYRRFCFLATVTPGEITPGGPVDEVWHLHLTDTRDYWRRWCAQALQMELHHLPGTGAAGERERLRQQYAHTLALYQRFFGPPPPAFWPAGLPTSRPRPWWRTGAAVPGLRWLLAGSAVIVLLTFTPQAFAFTNLPDMPGPDFIVLYLKLAALAVVTTLVWRRLIQPASSVPTPSGAGLDPLALALLSGGRPRLVDAGVASLLASGHVRVAAQKQRLDIVMPAPPVPAAPLDTLLQVIAREPDTAALVPHLGPIAAPVEARLRQRGLIDGPDERRQLRWSAIPVWAVIALGVAKILLSLGRDRPNGFLIAATVVLAIFAVALASHRRAHTAAGARLLARLRKDHAHALLAPHQQDVMLAVALGGTAVLASTLWADYHLRGSPFSAQNSSSDGGDSGGGSSGDEGGDGGSGCGGCGGGGD